MASEVARCPSCGEEARPPSARESPRCARCGAAPVEAWLAEARAAGDGSPLAHLRVDEVSVALERAIECAPAARKDEIRAGAAALLCEVAAGYHRKIRAHLDDYVSETRAWRDYLGRCRSVLRALELAHSLDPRQPLPLEKGIEICAEQIRGIVYTDVGDYQIVTERRHGVNREYEAELRRKIADFAAELKASRPDYQLPDLRRNELPDGGSCFVVTATLGDPGHPDAVAIRRLRDEVLVRTPGGRALIRAYETVGPRAARALRRSRVLRRLSRTLLVEPLASLLRRAM